MKALGWMARHASSAKEISAPPPSRRLVVAESGASGVDAVLEEGSWEETVVVSSEGGESGAGLPLRVITRLASLEQHASPLAGACIVTGPGHDDQTVAARELVARALLTHLTRGGGGELSLVAESPSQAGRDELLTLVDKLLGELESKSVTIRLQLRSALPALATSPTVAQTAHS